MNDQSNHSDPNMTTANIDESHHSVRRELERLLALWRELAASVELANQAILASDVTAMGIHTSRQRELCRVLAHLHAKLDAAKAAKQAGVPTEAEHSAVVRELGAELWETQAQVGRLNLRQGVWLRRSRRTADIFCRVLANSQATYPRPGPGV